MIDKKVIITGKRIYLRYLTKEDATKKYCSWINDKDINKFLVSKRTTVQELEEYIEVRYNNENVLFLGLFLNENDNHIGNIKLEPIDFIKKSATLGILIGEKDYWNKGYGTEALRILIVFAFNNLNIDEINLGLEKDNIGAIKAYEKSGFIVYDETDEFLMMKVSK